MYRFTTVFLLASISAPLALAQARPTTNDWSAPRFTLSTGYARVRSNAPPDQCDCFGANGGYFSAAMTLRSWLRVAGEVTGSHADNIGSLGQNLTLITYAAGPQVVVPVGRFELFGQALFGAAHGGNSYFPSATTVASSANSFALSTGGGVDIGITRRFGIRAAEVQYLRTSFPNASNNVEGHLVLGAGLLLRLGHSGSRDDNERQQAYHEMRDLNAKAKAAPPPMMPKPSTMPPAPPPTSTTLPAPEDSGLDFEHSVKSAFFDYDSYQLRPDANDALDKDAAYLRAHPAQHVVVGGYADERGTAEYNLALGEKRAQAARDRLIANGVSPDQLEVVSYGKEKQSCGQEDEACFQQNRRASLESRP